MYIEHIMSVEKINSFQVNVAAGLEDGYVDILFALRRGQRQWNRGDEEIFINEAVHL